MDEKELETVFTVAFNYFDFYEGGASSFQLEIPDDVDVNGVKLGFWITRDGFEFVPNGSLSSELQDQVLIWIPPSNILGIRRMRQYKHK